MNVFRVETKFSIIKEKSTLGPYSFMDTVDGSDYSPTILALSYNCVLHPEPMTDGIMYFTSDYYCGFATLKQLHTWFKKDLILMADTFYIGVYEINSRYVKLGKRQAMFMKDKGFLSRCIFL